MRRAAKGNHALHRYIELGHQILEAMGEQPGIERIVTGRDRRVSGEDALGRDRFERSGEIQSTRNAFAGQFQDQKRGVALVHVPGRRRESQCAQRAYPAQPQDHLLAYAHRGVAAV